MRAPPGPSKSAIAAYLATATVQLGAIQVGSTATTTIAGNNVGIAFQGGGVVAGAVGNDGVGAAIFLINNGGRLGFTGSSISATDPSLSTGDLFLQRDAANTLAQKNGNSDQTHRWYSSNAAYAQIQSLSESHTLAAAATSDTTITFPANSIGLGVTIRVTTLITGCTTLDVGIAGATTRYGTLIALTANTTNTGVGLTNPSIYAAATKIRFSAIGGGASFTAGVIRVTMHYISLSAPTS